MAHSHEVIFTYVLVLITIIEKNVLRIFGHKFVPTLATESDSKTG